jgi:TolB protein
LIADVLSYTLADRTVRSLPRATQFSAIAAPAWSPDGALLAVEVIEDVFHDEINHWFDYTSNLYVLRAAATTDSPWRALTVDGQSRSPSWSPDGARIAYIQRPMRSENSHIYVIEAGGGEATRLTRTEGAYRNPRWSPDGTRLAFSDGRVGNSDIFIVNADGSGLINVTQNTAFDAEPNWSPDGARLAFSSSRDNSQLDVYVVDVDGRNIKRLTNQLFGGGSAGPVWSPDGRQIAFQLTTYREDRSGLYVMNADGSFPLRLTQPPPNSWDSVPAWRR